MDVRQALSALPVFERYGHVTRVTDLAVEASGPSVALGEVCELICESGTSVEAEVVALRDHCITLMPYGAAKGLAVGARVIAKNMQPNVRVSHSLLGKVVDAFGMPLDGSSDLGSMQAMPLYPAPINPLSRCGIDKVVPTGIRVLDGLLPLGRGQRMGIFAGSGVGKSSLLGMLTRYIQADVVVLALIGERGREVHEFVAHQLTGASRDRTVIVSATAEQPAVLRARAAYSATAIAEYFRNQGLHVLLLMDSITRFAMARREIDLAAGQPPTARGYTPSVFSAIPALCERCGGLSSGGAITALYTVLVEGDDIHEPVADALRATLDGHIMLSRDLANEGHFPAVDVLHSVSRLASALMPPAQSELAREMRSLMAIHRRQHEMVDMGLYKSGANPSLDHALAVWPKLTQFLRQDRSECLSQGEILNAMQSAVAWQSSK